MTWSSKVLWYEGMFLAPQHFQQQERYIESLVEGRCGPLQGYAWGFSELALDPAELELGKVVLARARGVLADGTPFDIPAQDEPPPPLEIPPETRSRRVHLALPLRQAEKPDVSRPDATDGDSRYHGVERNVRDSVVGSDDLAELELARPGFRLLLGDEALDGYSTLGVALVYERQADRLVTLDENYIPPCLQVSASPRLQQFVKAVLGRVHQTAEEQAQWVRGEGRLSSANVADLLFLNVLNRYQVMLEHLSGIAAKEGARKARLKETRKE